MAVSMVICEEFQHFVDFPLPSVELILVHLAGYLQIALFFSYLLEDALLARPEERPLKKVCPLAFVTFVDFEDKLHGFIVVLLSSAAAKGQIIFNGFFDGFVLDLNVHELIEIAVIVQVEAAKDRSRAIVFDLLADLFTGLDLQIFHEVLEFLEALAGWLVLTLCIIFVVPAKALLAVHFVRFYGILLVKLIPLAIRIVIVGAAANAEVASRELDMRPRLLERFSDR